MDTSTPHWHGAPEIPEPAAQHIHVTAKSFLFCVRHALQLLEWRLTTTLCASPLVTDIITSVKENTILYCHTIDTSLKTSQDGVTYADDVISLYDGILSDEGLKVDVDIFQGTQDIVQDAEDILFNFREVRSGFNQVHHNIKSSQISREVFLKARKSHKRSVSPVSMITGFFPAAFVNKIGGKRAYKAEVTSNKVTEASIQLERILHDMEKLLENVSDFSRLWANICSKLASFKHFVTRLQSTHLNRERVKWMQIQIGHIKDCYQMYYSTLNNLHHAYPTLYLRSKSDNFRRLIDFKSTLSSLSQDIVQCQIALHSLGTILIENGPRTPLLYDTFKKVLFSLKREWELLVQHLNRVLVLHHHVTGDSATKATNNLDFLWWSMAIEELVKSSQQVVDAHAGVLDSFLSAKGVIWKNIRNHSSSRKMKTAAAAEEHLNSPDINTSDHETYEQQDASHALTTFETTLHEIDTSLQDMTSFWQASLAQFLSSNHHFLSSGVDYRSGEKDGFDFWGIKGDTTNDYLESISTSLEALTMDVVDISLLRVEGRRGRGSRGKDTAHSPAEQALKINLPRPRSTPLYFAGTPMASLPSTLSVTSESTNSSLTTIPGFMSHNVAGDAIYAFGELQLRGIEFIVIQLRLVAIRRLFPHENIAQIDGLEEAYDHLLELTRPGLYGERIRKQAFRLLVPQIIHQNTVHLVRSLMKWDMAEIGLFLEVLQASQVPLIEFVMELKSARVLPVTENS